MLEADLRHVDVAEHLGESYDTITRLAAHYRVRGIVDNLPFSGRPQITMPVQDCHIRMSHLLDQFLLAISHHVAHPDISSTYVLCDTWRCPALIM